MRSRNVFPTNTSLQPDSVCNAKHGISTSLALLLYAIFKGAHFSM